MLTIQQKSTSTTTNRESVKEKRIKAGLSKSSNTIVPPITPGKTYLGRFPLSPKEQVSINEGLRNLLKEDGYKNEETKNTLSSDAGRHRPT